LTKKPKKGYNSETVAKQEPKMKSTDLETQSAGYYAYAAARNARMTSAINASHFSEAQKIQAERMRLALEMVYSGTVHVNFRKKQITLKVDRPMVRDRRELALLEQDWEARGVIKRVSEQGINYKIAKV
jgi:hypothetical protein